MIGLTDYLRWTTDGRHGELLVEAATRRLATAGTTDLTAELAIARPDTMVRFVLREADERTASVAASVAAGCAEAAGCSGSVEHAAAA